jgi:NAD(P)-dependent dehydrogenase (short-subunit alcohol dehydrogenase family)
VIIADIALRPEAEALLAKYKSSPRALFHKTDVTDWKQLTACFERAAREFGELDIVCPGAGIFEPHFSNFWVPPGTGKSIDDPAGDRYKMMDINLTHPIRATQLALSAFLNPPTSGQRTSPTRPKRIIHISSIAGQTSFITHPMYHASKHAINGFVWSLATLEATLGVRVAAVAPGVIRTPLWTENPEKTHLVDEARDAWVEPREVAEAMLALCEDPQYPGGTVLEVGKAYTRVVGQFGDMGPMEREGVTVGHMEKGVKEVFGWLGQDKWGIPKSKL